MICSPDSVANPNGRKVLLISNELNRTGAPVMLLNLAGVMLEHGDNITVMAPIDGPQRDEYLALGIPVIISSEMKKPHGKLSELAKSYDLIVVNTLACANAVKALGRTSTPVIWWAHEGHVAFDYYKNRLPKSIPDNVRLLCASEYTQCILKTWNEGYNSKLLRCYTDDIRTVLHPDSGNYILTAGSLERHKGQDVFADAVAVLPDDYRNRVQFRLAGNTELDKKYAEKVLVSPGITYVGLLNKDALLDMYVNSLCLVIPSRDDSTSMVGVEAAMLGKPFIVSNAAGISSLITNGVNGLVFESGNAADLADKIKYAIDNPDKMQRMGLEARKLYEKYYTREAFDEAWSVCGSL